ncbi:MAG: hypothetical protein ABI597_11235 [Gammaproteobacteria bacterium]
MQINNEKLISIKNHNTTHQSTVKVWDIAKFECIGTVEVNAKLDEVIPSDDGRTVIGVSQHKEHPTVHFIDLQDKTTQTHELEKSETFFKVVMLPNNNLLVLSNDKLAEFQWAHDQVKIAIETCLAANGLTKSIPCGLVSEYVGTDIVSTNPCAFYAKNNSKPYFARANIPPRPEAEIAPGGPSLSN